MGYQFQYSEGLLITDAVYHLRFIVPHSHNTVRFNFFASGLQGVADESWGLDNVSVNVAGTSSDACALIDPIDNAIEVFNRFSSVTVPTGQYSVSVQSGISLGQTDGQVKKVVFYNTDNLNPYGFFYVISEGVDRTITVSGIGTDANIIYGTVLDDAPLGNSGTAIVDLVNKSTGRTYRLTINGSSNAITPQRFQSLSVSPGSYTAFLTSDIDYYGNLIPVKKALIYQATPQNPYGWYYEIVEGESLPLSVVGNEIRVGLIDRVIPDNSGQAILTLRKTTNQSFNVVQITDVHIGGHLSKPEENELNVNNILKTIERFSKVLRHLATIHPTCIIDTGDLIYHNDINFDVYAKYFATYEQMIGLNDKSNFTIPLHVIPGNHDRYIDRFATSYDLEKFNNFFFRVVQKNGIDYKYIRQCANCQVLGYYFNLGSWWFIGLDGGADLYHIDLSYLTPESTGLEDVQYYSLFGNPPEPTAGTCANRQTVIFMHQPALREKGHNPNVGTSNPGKSDACISNHRIDFIRECARHNVSLVLAGHTHQDEIISVSYIPEAFLLSFFVNEDVPTPATGRVGVDYPLFVQTRNATEENNLAFRKIEFSAANFTVHQTTKIPKQKSVSSVIYDPQHQGIHLHVWDTAFNHNGFNGSEIEKNIPDSLFIGDSRFSDGIELAVCYPKSTADKFSFKAIYPSGGSGWKNDQQKNNEAIIDLIFRMDTDTETVEIQYLQIAMQPGETAEVQEQGLIFNLGIDNTGDGLADEFIRPQEFSRANKNLYQITFLAPVKNRAGIRVDDNLAEITFNTKDFLTSQFVTDEEVVVEIFSGENTYRQLTVGNGVLINTEEQKYQAFFNLTDEPSLILNQIYSLLVQFGPETNCRGITLTQFYLILDADQDGVADELDNCPNIYNPFQVDLDQNGIGDACQQLFIRGDPNDSGQIDIADAIFILSYLFAQGKDSPCEKSADANDDGSLDIGDPITILGHLFAQAGPLSPPFNKCGVDLTKDNLSCQSFNSCQ